MSYHINPRPDVCAFVCVCVRERETARYFVTNLKRVSADLEGPAKTNLLLVLCVKKGLIIL